MKAPTEVTESILSISFTSISHAVDTAKYQQRVERDSSIHNSFGTHIARVHTCSIEYPDRFPCSAAPPHHIRAVLLVD